jgi:hypothetical protein
LSKGSRHYFFVSNPHYVEEILRLFPRYSPSAEDRFIMASEIEAQYLLEKVAVPFAIPDTYVPAECYPDIHSRALSMGRGWYRHNAELEQALTYDGVNFGKMLPNQLYFTFSQIFWTIDMVTNLLERQKPEEVIAFLPAGKDDPQRYAQRGPNANLLTFDDFCLERITILAAAAHGIKAREEKILASRVANPIQNTYRGAFPLRFWSPYFLRKKHSPGLLFKAINHLMPGVLSTLIEKSMRKEYDIMLVGDGTYITGLVSLLKQRGYSLFGCSSRRRNYVLRGLLPGIGLSDGKALLERLSLPEADEIRHTWERIDRLTVESYGGQFQYKGIDYTTVIMPKMVASLETIKLSMLQYRAARDLIRDRHVKLVLTSVDSHLSTNPFMEAGNGSGVKTLSLQHGFVEFNNTGIFPVFCQRHVTLGRHAADYFVAEGTPAEKLPELGIVRFDAYRQPVDKERIPGIKKSLGIEEGTPVILYFSPHYEFQGWRIVQAVPTPNEGLSAVARTLSALSALGQYRVLFRYHPAYFREAVFNEIIVKKAGPNLFLRQIDLLDSLLIADLVLANHICTTAIEALMCDKPLIYLDLFRRFPMPSYVTEGAAEYVADLEQLPGLIQRLLYDEEARQKLAERRRLYLEQSVAGSDGSATKSVAGLIDSLIAGAQQD